MKWQKWLASSGIPLVAVAPVSDGDAGVTPPAVTPVTAPGAPRGPEGSQLPGARPAPRRSAGCWCPGEEKRGVLCHNAGRGGVTMLGRVPPRDQLGAGPVPATRTAAMATAARPGTAERPQRPRAAMDRLPGCPTASLIGCHTVGAAHSLPI